jgi:hypothetical protein
MLDIFLYVHLTAVIPQGLNRSTCSVTVEHGQLMCVLLSTIAKGLNNASDGKKSCKCGLKLISVLLVWAKGPLDDQQ